MASPANKPAKADPEKGKEFIEGIRKGLDDYAEGRYKVFKNADELLIHLSKINVKPRKIKYIK